MKTSTFFIALLIASASYQQQALIKGCFIWNQQNGTCETCYRRQVSTRGCGPLLPVSDTCLLHMESLGQKTDCVLCRPGYGLSQNRCVPYNIFNCLAYAGSNKCIICGNGQYPTPDGTQCAPLATGAIPHCEWGLRHLDIACSRCSPGYVLSATYSSCIPSTSALTGCWGKRLNGTCYNCDVLAGYSMQKNGKCKFIKNE